MDTIKVLTRTLKEDELEKVTKYAEEKYAEGAKPVEIQYLINLRTGYTASKMVKNGIPVLIVNKY